MRIAISNIAWDPSEDDQVAPLLARYRIDAIDIAPAKYFPIPVEATDSDIRSVRSWWADRGVEITGMQALLFGTSGLNVFGDEPNQAALLAHLTAVGRIAAGLGATRLVFGSPKNRDRAGLSDGAAAERAVSFFRRLGDRATAAGVFFCLEPNPARYGANFMLDSAETAAIVEAADHPAIRMQLDTGALSINAEDARQVVETYFRLIGHVHASEPDLVPLGDGDTNHSLIAALVARYLPEQVVSIEMLATKNEPHLVAIERALAFASRHYASPEAKVAS
jgi:sugar phosphate isomerase/epimerase